MDPTFFRTYLNKLEDLNEATLTPAQIIKYADRFDVFLKHIRASKPFYTEVDGTAVTLDPSEADRYEQLYDADKFAGKVMGTDVNGKQWPLSGFRKTAEFGGASASPGEGEDVQSKEGALVKPSQINITDRTIPASSLGQEIISNSVLQSTEYGKIVIAMAQNLMASVPAVLPKNSAGGITKAIVDYAGEYLGVLALINDQSNFPKRSEFLEWLGGDMGSLQIFFPSKSNTPLADSFASIKNPTSERQINISSKGSGGGAAPSVSTLLVPESVRSKKAYKTVVNLIDICQNRSLPAPTSISQVFEAMNLLFEDVPEKIPSEYKNFLPWPSDITKEVVESIKSGVPMPKYVSLIGSARGKGTDGGKLTYVTKVAVMKLVNEELPEFQAAVLEILDHNFIQQYTDLDKKSGELKFYTQWPAKLDGVVTMETKSGATDPTKGGFSFKLKPAGGKAELMGKYVSSEEEQEQTTAKIDKVVNSNVKIRPPGAAALGDAPGKKLSPTRDKR